VALQVEIFLLGQLLRDRPMTDPKVEEFIAEVEELAQEHK
jgi:hypothetical protein